MGTFAIEHATAFDDRGRAVGHDYEAADPPRRPKRAKQADVTPEKVRSVRQALVYRGYLAGESFEVIAKAFRVEEKTVRRDVEKVRDALQSRDEYAL